MRKLFLLVVFTLCSIKVQAEQNELLYGLKVSGNTLAVQVKSQGCTNDKSFRLVWENNNLTVMRVKPDHCRRLPHLIWVTFSFEPTQYPFAVANKLDSPTSFNRS